MARGQQVLRVLQVRRIQGMERAAQTKWPARRAASALALARGLAQPPVQPGLRLPEFPAAYRRLCRL